MYDWRRVDRTQSSAPLWFAADAVVTVMFVWITVESLRSDAYVDQFGAVTGWGWALAISPTLLLSVRRLAPATALVVATALYMIASGFQGDTNAPLAIPFFTYSVGLTRPPRTSAWMVGLAAIAASSGTLYGPGDLEILTIPVWLMLFAIGWLIALSIRHNQSRATNLAVEAASLRAERSLVAEQAAEEERARIARELHDAVGHAVNVIVLHAGAARMAASEQSALDALREIEQVGRSALQDLDHMLGLLHHGVQDAAPLEPAHGADDIEGLVKDLNAAGVDVHFDNRCGRRMAGSLGRLQSAAVYRIVQEALTNAVKHAGRARIDVTVACEGPAIEICVEDDGVGASAATPAGGGRGIAGMKERAEVLGGSLEARAVEGAGFRVQARIPRGHHAVPDGATDATVAQ